jgi:chromosome partitioning protein
LRLDSLCCTARLKLTLAQLFGDKLEPHCPAKFSIDKAIVHGVSRIDGRISRLDLLPSSIDFIDIQEKLPFVAMHGNYEQNPQDILRQGVVNKRDAVPPAITHK